MTFLRLSVIIPTYNRRTLLEGELNALARQTLRPNRYEVIVIVDGSTDGTCEMLAKLVTPYPLVWRRQENAGRAAACNAGIMLAQGDLVVLLDDDMDPTNVCLEAHAAKHSDGARRAVIGAAPVVVGGSVSASARYVANKFNRHVQKLTQATQPLALRDFYSGNLSIRRDVLMEVGGFDSDFRTYGNEDLDLCFRLRRGGVEIVFAACARANQHYIKDFAALAEDTVHKGRSARLLVMKHPGVFAELKLATWQHASTRRRLVVGCLIALTKWWPAISRVIIRGLGILGRLMPNRVQRAHEVALDYFYFLGAETQCSLPGRRNPL